MEDEGKLDKVKRRAKQHWDENKKTYYACGITAGVVGGIVFFGSRNVQIAESFNLIKAYWKSPTFNYTVLSDTTNHSIPVRCIETGELYASLRRAEKAVGAHSGALTKHLQGIKSHVNGHTFEVVPKTT